jgi:DNA repair protein RecO (recombination protein O)
MSSGAKASWSVSREAAQMPSYSVTGINIGTFNLGESDRLLTIFTAERGILRAVAKGARKPGAKMTGRSELLHVNHLLLNTGRSLDIITQAESVEAFPQLRTDLVRLTFALYYAELTAAFAEGLSDESAMFFDYLRDSIRAQAEQKGDAPWLCLQFEMSLLEMLGYRPELTCCVVCRSPLTDYALSAFHQDWGGIICRSCFDASRAPMVREDDESGDLHAMRASTQITPLVWKQLILAGDEPSTSTATSLPLKQSILAARRLMQSYIEHRAGKRMKSLDLVRDHL